MRSNASKIHRRFTNIVPNCTQYLFIYLISNIFGHTIAKLFYSTVPVYKHLLYIYMENVGNEPLLAPLLEKI